MADNNTIARPYADAIFSYAQESGALAAWSEALALAGPIMADGQVNGFLSRPALTDAQRLELLTGLFGQAGGEGSLLGGGDEHGLNFLRLLVENDRVNVLPEISQHFEALKAEVENTVDVIVTSAVPLDDSQRQEITEALKKRLGRDVRLQTEVDENLIGGAVISAGDVVIDGSLRARLEGLAGALTA